LEGELVFIFYLFHFDLTIPLAAHHAVSRRDFPANFPSDAADADVVV
jgi:hypothetical protein